MTPGTRRCYHREALEPPEVSPAAGIAAVEALPVNVAADQAGTATGTDFSIGTPTRLPYSVHDPS